MNDAKDRPIEVGDWVATPDLHVVGGEVREGAVLGKVQGVTGNLVYLGDGITYESQEIITLGGYVWVFCLECNSPWVKDVCQDETCPFCESGRYEVDRPASSESVITCR